MTPYAKPTIVNAAAIGGILPLVGLSAAKLAVVGVAAGLGLGSLLKGNSILDLKRMNALTAQKNFALG